VLSVTNPNAPTQVSIGVVLSGLDRTVATTSTVIGSGDQTVAVPIDVSVGAWSAVGVANLSPRLLVTMDYAVADPSSPTPMPTPTLTPTPAATASPASEVVSTESAAPSVPAPASSLALPVGETGLTHQAKTSLWNSIATAPKGAKVTVAVRAAIPQRGATAGDIAAARVRAARVEAFIRRTSLATGADVRVVILPPLRLSRAAAMRQVSARVSWKAGTSLRTISAMRVLRYERAACSRPPQKYRLPWHRDPRCCFMACGPTPIPGRTTRGSKAPSTRSGRPVRSTR